MSAVQAVLHELRQANAELANAEARHTRALREVENTDIELGIWRQTVSELTEALEACKAIERRRAEKPPAPDTGLGTSILPCSTDDPR